MESAMRGIGRWWAQLFVFSCEFFLHYLFKYQIEWVLPIYWFFVSLLQGQSKFISQAVALIVEVFNRFNEFLIHECHSQPFILLQYDGSDFRRV